MPSSVFIGWHRFVLARAAKFNHYLEQGLSKDSLKCNAELGRVGKEFYPLATMP